MLGNFGVSDGNIGAQVFGNPVAVALGENRGDFLEGFAGVDLFLTAAKRS